MATTTFRVCTPDTGADPNTSGAFTPALGDLLIVFVQAAASIQAETAHQVTSSVGMEFYQFGRRVYASSTHCVYGYVSTGFVINAASQTITWTSGDAATGTVICVFSVSGMTRRGYQAIRQVAGTTNGAAAATPAPAFASSCLTGNVTFGAIANNSNPAGMTAPTGWTENASADVGYINPTSGFEAVYRDSGFTGTTVTWNSASASTFAALIVELDTTDGPKSLSAMGAGGAG